MAVYFVTGKLGAGKSLAAVGKIRDYLREGRRVATNLDLNLDGMLPASSRATATRLPDKPRVEDLAALGYGCDEPDYSGKTFGLIVLDELATWFNSRTWQDKERLPVIDWFLHARKYRWDVVFIVQDMDSLDKQLVSALCEHLVVCKRMSAYRLPLIGWTGKLIRGKAFHMPAVHLGLVFYGATSQAQLVDRWVYQGKELYGAYDTGQVFKDGRELLGGNLVDMRASFSYLSAWHLVGRYQVGPGKSFAQVMFERVRLGVAAVVALAGLVAGRSPAASLARLGITRPVTAAPLRDSGPYFFRDTRGPYRLGGLIGRREAEAAWSRSDR